MKQIGLAFQQYLSDYDDTMPTFVVPATETWACTPPYSCWFEYKGWPVVLHSYVKNGDIYRCPSNVERDPYWLQTNPGTAPLDQTLLSVAPRGVSYIYRRGFSAAPVTAGHPLTGDEFSRPAETLMTFEYSSWHTDPRTAVGQCKIDYGKLSLNTLFMDGHAKVVKGLKFRHAKYDVNTGWRAYCGGGGVSLEYFLDSNGVYTADPRGGNGETFDVE
jgi:prepilin-type processing-associated H-X9-DG protein